jgi:heterotetrameric sarcosine oxidase gamma subunit
VSDAVLPLAHSPIHPPAPVTVVSGWEVSALRSYAPLRLADLSPLAKVLVRAAPDGAVAARLGVPLGSARRDEHGTLVVGSGPGEWLLLAAPGRAADVADRIDPADDRLVTVQDFTHGRALVRLTGAAAGDALSKLCAIDLGGRATPDGRAFRSSVAQVTTDVVRDDVDGTRSYLLHCERSSGQYLFDVLLDAGREFGIERDGFPTNPSW